MGTSKSSTGPGPGVPLVPEWVPGAGPPTAPATGGGGESDPAPARRFGAARTSLGRFAHSGSPEDMRRGLGHYVRKGYGGAATAARRMGGTARIAGVLYDALSFAAAGQAAPPGSPFDPARLSSSSADEVMDALVEAVRPVDGTQDAEAGRVAVRNAASDVLNKFPDADLLALSEDERLFAIERFLAHDVFNRFRLDVGQAIQDKAPSVSAALSRLAEVRDYVFQIISRCFRNLREADERLDGQRISDMAEQALQETFAVFEDYVQ